MPSIKDSILRQIVDAGTDRLELASTEFWIPFISANPQATEFEIACIEASHHDLASIQFNCVPSINSVKVFFLQTILKLDIADAIKLLSGLWQKSDPSKRSVALIKTAELVYKLEATLKDLPNKDEVCICEFGYNYYEVRARVALLQEIILRDVSTLRLFSDKLPKWKGKPMQFIELISIGIELDLFEGANQNQICNSLLKAFQVDAESDQPIYKQRFNALFKRSKIHLPLIADYIGKIEEAKRMKIVFTNT